MRRTRSVETADQLEGIFKSAPCSVVQAEMAGAQQRLAVGAGHALYRLRGRETVFDAADRPAHDDRRARQIAQADRTERRTERRTDRRSARRPQCHDGRRGARISERCEAGRRRGRRRLRAPGTGHVR